MGERQRSPRRNYESVAARNMLRSLRRILLISKSTGVFWNHSQKIVANDSPVFHHKSH